MTIWHFNEHQLEYIIKQNQSLDEMFPKMDTCLKKESRENLFKALCKGTVYTKMKLTAYFTHPHIVLNPYDLLSSMDNKKQMFSRMFMLLFLNIMKMNVYWGCQASKISRSTINAVQTINVNYSTFSAANKTLFL